MRVRDVITQVRNIVQDTGDSPRYPNAMLVGYVNMAVQSIAVARPDLFACIDWVDLNNDSVTVRAPRDSIRIIEVNHTQQFVAGKEKPLSGPVLAEIDIKQLNRGTPNWRSEAYPFSGSPEDRPREYARNVRNPDTIFIHPAVVWDVENENPVQIEMEYACSPRVITVEQVLEQTGNTKTIKSGVPGYEKELVWPDEIELLPDSYFPIVVDGTIFLVEAMEDEAVNSRRAEVFLNKFNAALGITASSRILTDTLRAGLPKGSAVVLNAGDEVGR